MYKSRSEDRGRRSARAIAMIFVVGAACLLVAGGIALPRAGRELAGAGAVSMGTFLLAFVAYAGLGIAAFAAAWTGEAALPLSAPLAVGLGGPVFLSGAALFGTARATMGSFRLTWGLATDRLVTHGPYALCRHPQSVGWLLVLIGAGLLGRSTSTLGLGVLYGLSCLVWLPREERALARRHGSAWQDYTARVPRWIGFPRRGRTDER